MSTFDYLLNNLSGLGPIDWDQAKKDYKIAGFEPEKLEIVPRDDMMQSLVTVTEPASLERAIWKQTLPSNASEEAIELKKLSREYIVLTNKKARLPKFSKWVSSMFAGNDKLMLALAKAGQTGGAKSDIIISCNPIDILRGADSAHFWSCLGGDGGFKKVLAGVVSRCPGIAVAYIDHPQDNKMQCRIWLNHARVKGRDCVAMLRPYGNGFSQQQIADLIASKGYDVYSACGYGGATAFELINGFDTKGADKGIHWDITEYGALLGDLIAKAKCEPVAVAPVKKRRAA